MHALDSMNMQFNLLLLLCCAFYVFSRLLILNRFTLHLIQSTNTFKKIIIQIPIKKNVLVLLFRQYE